MKIELLLILSLAAAGCAADDASPPPPRPRMPAIEVASGSLHGTVLERLDAGSYTYLSVGASDGRQTWVVTLGAGAPVGTDVVVRRIGRRSPFHSRRLDRTFEDLVFGIVTTA